MATQAPVLVQAGVPAFPLRPQTRTLRHLK